MNMAIPIYIANPVGVNGTVGRDLMEVQKKDGPLITIPRTRTTRMAATVMAVVKATVVGVVKATVVAVVKATVVVVVKATVAIKKNNI